TTGGDGGARARSVDPPHGRGISGVLTLEAKPLRLRDLHEDPRSVGFPPNHPPMGSFLGVPILLRSVAFGNLLGLLEGRLTVESSPDAGATLVVEVPLA